MPMLSAEKRIQELNITLPAPPQKAGMYMQARRVGNLLLISGCGPDLNGEELLKGKLGDIPIEAGQEAARCCALNALAILRRELGSLDRIRQVLKMLVFVSSTDSFTQQPIVANGASQLLIDVFGLEAGCPTRSAIGVNVLPGNIPVEAEFMFEITE